MTVAHVPNGTLNVLPEEEYGLLDLDRFLGQPNDGTAVYCCGPGPLLDAVEQRCQRWPKGALHVERFAPSKNGSEVTNSCQAGISGTCLLGVVGGIPNIKTMSSPTTRGDRTR